MRGWAAFLAAVVAAAAKGKLNPLGENPQENGFPNEPEVNPVMHAIMDQKVKTEASTVKGRLAAITTRMRGALGDAMTAEYDAGRREMMIKGQEADLAKLKEARMWARKAGQAADVAVAALEEARRISAEAVATAEKLAEEDVKADLVKQYHALDEWRNTFLADPAAKVKAAERKAAEPYNKMIRQIYARMHEYQLNAAALNGQASAAHAEATGLSGGANGKVQGGDIVGGEQDMAKAEAARLRGNALAGTAASFDGQARSMLDLVPQYIAAGYQAAWAAGYKADPNVVPAPQYSQTAYAMPGAGR